jgi:large subunit ribosomal protein L21
LALRLVCLVAGWRVQAAALSFFERSDAGMGRYDDLAGTKNVQSVGAPRQDNSSRKRRQIVAPLEVFLMYAVIRTGGKQYRVAPGDTLKIEKTAQENGLVEFSDVLAVSSEEGKFESQLTGAKVTAQVLGEGRGDKILVFKLKRKKQYKKMQGHRQSFVEVKINEILVNGKTFKA